MADRIVLVSERRARPSQTMSNTPTHNWSTALPWSSISFQPHVEQDSGVALQKAQEGYQAGLAIYLKMSSIETTALQARLTQITIGNRRLMPSVLLIKALGETTPRSLRLSG